MRSITGFLLLLSCLPASAGMVTVAPVVAAPALAAPKPLEAGDIAKAVELYNSANSIPRYLLVGTVSSHLFLSADGKSVEPKELPALIARGQAVTIKHSTLVMDVNQEQPPTVFLSTPKTVSGLEQLREWAESARSSLALGGFGEALEKAKIGAWNSTSQPPISASKP